MDEQVTTQHWWNRTKRRTPKDLLAVKSVKFTICPQQIPQEYSGREPGLRRTESVNNTFACPLVC